MSERKFSLVPLVSPFPCSPTPPLLLSPWGDVGDTLFL